MARASRSPLRPPRTRRVLGDALSLRLNLATNKGERWLRVIGAGGRPCYPTAICARTWKNILRNTPHARGSRFRGLCPHVNITAGVFRPRNNRETAKVSDQKPTTLQPYPPPPVQVSRFRGSK